MSIEQDIAALQREAAQRTKDRAKAEAALAQANGRVTAVEQDLAEEFGVADIEQARQKAERLEQALKAEADRVRQELARAGGEQ